ncbi:UNVERIFIED_CONTAM: hypothetical protein HDU68_006130, partial [Siphonaria sp. JEL0065]
MVCTKCEAKLGKLIHAEVKKRDSAAASSSSSSSASDRPARSATNTLLSKKNKNKFAP